MADNIKLVTSAGSTVTPQDDALVYETAIAQSGLIYGCNVTLKNNNTLHITAGHGIICGRKFTIYENDLTILLTTGESKNGRIYVHLDLSNITEPIQIMTETGSVLSEPIQNMDINISNGIYEFNLATFKVDALTISELVDLRPTIERTKDAIKRLEEELKNAKVDTVTTMEQAAACTDPEKPIGVGAFNELTNSLEEQPQFVYDEEGKITGYTTKIGGADTVFPFINDDILVCARLQPTNSQETAFSVGNFKIPSDGVYKIYFVSSTSYWSSGTVTIGNDIAFEIPTYNNYTAGNHIFEEERECKTGEEINIISQVIAGTLCILLYKIT